MPLQLTREELYELVWKRPVTKLANEFGLSDVALHKICRKHDIPTSPAGYWAKKAHGKVVSVTPLPRPRNKTTILVSEGAVTNEAEAPAAARGAVMTALAEWEPRDASAQPAVIERTILKLDSAKPKRDGHVKIEGNGLISVWLQPGSIERAGQLLRLLGDAAVHAGIELVATGRPAAWQYEGEEVSFTLEEATDQVRHLPTEAEKAAVARWEAKRQADFQRYGYLSDWGRPRILKWEQQFNGRLAVRLEEVRVQSVERRWGPIVARSFADSKTRPLEKMIPRILSTVAAIAVTKRENRAIEERRREFEEEAAHRRAEELRRTVTERVRLELLGVLLTEHAEQTRLEGYLALLERGEPDAAAAPRAERLRCWAEDRLQRLRADSSGAGLEARLARLQLFDKDGT